MRNFACPKCRQSGRKAPHARGVICVSLFFLFTSLSPQRDSFQLLLAEAAPQALKSEADLLTATLAELGFNPKQIAKVVRRADSRFVKIWIANARNNFNWLKSRGIRNPEAVVIAMPPVLGMSIHENLEPKFNWLKRNCSRDTADLISRHPQLLSYSVATNLERKRKWLMEQGVRDPAKLIGRFPAVFHYGIASKLAPASAWLRSKGIENPGRVIERLPTVLGYSISGNLEPKVMWLKSHGVKDVAAVIETFPPILSSSIQDTLEPAAEWMQSQGFRNLGPMIEKYPAIFSLSIEGNLKPKINWLRERGMKNIASMIEAFPSLLGYSLENNLSPKIDILETTWGLTSYMIESNPALLGLSLSRIEGVAQMLGALGLSPNQDFSWSEKRRLLQRFSDREIFERLQDLQQIGREYDSVFEIAESHRPSRQWLLGNKDQWLKKSTCRQAFKATEPDF